MTGYLEGNHTDQRQPPDSAVPRHPALAQHGGVAPVSHGSNVVPGSLEMDGALHHLPGPLGHMEGRARLVVQRHFLERAVPVETVVDHPLVVVHRVRHSRHGRLCEGAADGAGHIRRLLADKGYDADWLRAHLRAFGVVPVTPGARSRKRPIRHDRRRHKDRWRAEAVFCRLKNFRRVASRYGRLAHDYASAVALAAVVAFWR